MSFDVANAFHTAFDEGVEEAKKKSPNYPVGVWDASGRASAQYPNKKNEAWWRANGPAMVEKYLAWRAETRWDPVSFEWWDDETETHGTHLGIELELNFRLGAVEIRGFIDRLWVLPTGDLCVMDIKTGDYIPPSGMQLGVYATGVELTYGVRPQWGAFWLPNKGLCGLQRLDQWTAPVLEAIFEDVDFGIENEVFPPHPGMLCGSCSVRDYCFVMNGGNAQGIDPLSTLSTLPTDNERKESA